jgi:hypothetical protein
VTLGLPSGIKIGLAAVPSIVTVAFSGIGIEVIINLVRLTPDPISIDAEVAFLTDCQLKGSRTCEGKHESTAILCCT